MYGAGAVQCRVLMVALVAVFGTGCHREVAPARTAGSGGGTETSSTQVDFTGRLDAAAGINNTATKDDALGQLVRDAADAGEAETVQQALRMMTNVALMDKAAYSASLRLAKAHRTDAAAATAKMITDVSLKDKVQAKIAKGETDE